MKSINASPSRVIELGYEGENKVTQIKFRYNESWLEYGSGEFKIRVLRPGEKEAYNATTVVDDREKMLLIMTVTDIELSIKGSGEMQVVYTGADFVRKSPIYRYNVHRAIDEPVAPPSGSIITEIVESLVDIRDDIGDLTELTTTDKSSLVSAINEVAEKGGASVTVDDALSTESENPVQNKVITGALAGKADKSLVDVLTDDVAEAKTDVGALKTTVQGKADTATVSALNDAVNGLDSDVQGLQTTVQSKADTATVTALSGTVSGLQTTVQSKADTSTVTALSGTVSDLSDAAQQYMEYTNSAITNLRDRKANKSDVDSKASKFYVDTQLAGKVDDVQVNGTSIVADGVANVPVADYNNFGVTKFNATSGVFNNNGVATIYPAVATEIKSGNNLRKPIVPVRQHESVFYGLAKVAGYDEKDSALSVGQYSDEAKVAIQKMLGIYEAPWELINEETFTHETEANFIINTDSNGEPLELTEALLCFETPKQATAAKKGSYGQVAWQYNNGNQISTETGAWSQEANANAKGLFSYIKIDGALIFTAATQVLASGSAGNWRTRFSGGIDAIGAPAQGIQFSDTIKSVSRIIIYAVTGTGHYKLYGKRKWQ